jgi:hypothetical protein
VAGDTDVSILAEEGRACDVTRHRGSGSGRRYLPAPGLPFPICSGK